MRCPESITRTARRPNTSVTHTGMTLASPQYSWQSSDPAVATLPNPALPTVAPGSATVPQVPIPDTPRESSVLETRTSGMTHAPGRLHSGRDRPGTIRANLVGDLRFRVRSYVILKRLPIASLILYFLARQTDWQESLQGTNIRQSCLEFS